MMDQPDHGTRVTWNTCPECGRRWKDEIATPGVLHRTQICKPCQHRAEDASRSPKGGDLCVCRHVLAAHKYDEHGNRAPGCNGLPQCDCPEFRLMSPTPDPRRDAFRAGWIASGYMNGVTSVDEAWAEYLEGLE